MRTPRISVNDLALYMVSSDTARLGIIRRAKTPIRPPIIRYKDVRGPICQHLTDINRHGNPLSAAEAMFEQRRADPSETTLRQDDAKNSIEVIHGIQRMRNQLGPYSFEQAPFRQPKLIIEGVEVSIHADMLVHATTRAGVGQIGAAILRMTQSDVTSESAIAKRREMGLYVATLASVHVEANLSGNRQTASKLCMSIDVQHGEIFIAPASTVRRISDITSACRFIAALWLAA